MGQVLQLCCRVDCGVLCRLRHASHLFVHSRGLRVCSRFRWCV
jgi:hypothetical protein